MKQTEKASVPLKKILCISVIFFLILTGIGAVAANAELNQVKIILANGYEMNVLTTKTQVGEILQDNHIILLPEEKVVPQTEEELADNNTIRILAKEEEHEEVAEENQEDISVEHLLENYYAEITEKIVTEQIEIPFETVTKDVSDKEDEKQEEVIQEGENGIKEITYKAKYQNEEEIERVEISSEIIKEPVEKIAEVRTKTVTSRGSVDRTKATTNPAKTSGSSIAASVQGIEPVKKTLNASAYSAQEKGVTNKTASGATAREWYTVAAGKGYAMGTVIYIPYFKNAPNGGWFVVQDRGGAISNSKIDIYMATKSECNQFGRRNLECYIYEK